MTDFTEQLHKKYLFLSISNMESNIFSSLNSVERCWHYITQVINDSKGNRDRYVDSSPIHQYSLVKHYAKTSSDDND